MKILIDDGFTISKGTGIGNYTKYLYNSLQKNGEEVVLFKYKENKNKILNRVLYLKHLNSKQYQKYIEQFDYVIYTNYTVPKKKNNHTKYVSVIHDLVSFKYPKTLPLLNRFFSKNTIKNSLKKANYIFTVSNTIKSEIFKLFPKYKYKIHVFYPGLYDKIHKIDTNYFNFENENLKSINKKEFLFLFVSTIEKRKNISFVIDAFDLYKKNTQSKSKLIIVGKNGYGYEEIMNNVYKKKYKDDIIFTGYISDNDVNILYNISSCYIFPSIYEGFGSCQLECMSTKLPMLLSDIPTNREISSNYAKFFKLNDINSLCDGMIEIENKYAYYKKKYNNIANYLEKFKWDDISRDIIFFLKKGE